MSKTKKIKVIVSVLVLASMALSSTAYAAAAWQYNVTLVQVGEEGFGVQASLGITPNPNNCLNGGVYFNASTSEVSKVLSIALAAKLSGKTVTVHFTQASAGAICLGDAIYLE